MRGGKGGGETVYVIAFNIIYYILSYNIIGSYIL